MAPEKRRLATGGEKARASRLRKLVQAGEHVSDVDRLWLADFEERHPRGRPPIIDVDPTPATRSAGSTDHGRSRSGRRVKFEMEEAAESEGTGAAAPTAAGMAVAALTSREEGRRIDSLTMNALAIMEAACERTTAVCDRLLGMLDKYQSHHVDYLDQLREAQLARTHAETDAITVAGEAAQQGDPAKEMMLMVLLKHLGVQLPDGANPADVFKAAARQAGAGGKKPPPNGAAAKTG